MTRTMVWIAPFILAPSIASGGDIESGRYFLSSDILLTGSTANPIHVQCDNTFDVMGFSFGINYDETVLSVAEVTNVGTDSGIADFFDGRIDSVNGLVGS